MLRVIIRISIVVMLLGYSIVSVAQMDSAIDIAAGVDYSYRLLQGDSENGQFAKDSRDREEFPKLNYNVGVNYNGRISERLYWRSGVRFLTIGYQTRDMFGRWPSEIDPDGGFEIDPTLPRNLHLKWDYYFLQLPLGMRYHLSENRLNAFVEGSVVPSLFLNRRTSVTTGDETKNYYTKETHFGSYNPMHLVGAFSLGASFDIDAKSQLFLQSTVRYHFTESIEAPLSEYLCSIGLEFGIRRSIK